VGLGNPGREYSHNRHNVGFQCVQAVARRHSLAFSERRARARVARGKIEGQEVALARPQTFMNRSGQAVAGLVRALGLELQDLLVVYDDLDLPLGEIRLRPSGSPGGHHGLESIAALLGTAFPRLRVGIGRPGDGDVVSYVLGDFSPDEEKVLEETVPLVSQAIECYLKEGLEAAMNQFNRRPGRQDGPPEA